MQDSYEDSIHDSAKPHAVIPQDSQIEQVRTCRRHLSLATIKKSIKLPTQLHSSTQYLSQFKVPVNTDTLESSQPTSLPQIDCGFVGLELHSYFGGLRFRFRAARPLELVTLSDYETLHGEELQDRASTHTEILSTEIEHESLCKPQVTLQEGSVRVSSTVLAKSLKDKKKDHDAPLTVDSKSDDDTIVARKHQYQARYVSGNRQYQTRSMPRINQGSSSCTTRNKLDELKGQEDAHYMPNLDNKQDSENHGTTFPRTVSTHLQIQQNLAHGSGQKRVIHESEGNMSSSPVQQKRRRRFSRLKGHSWQSQIWTGKKSNLLLRWIEIET